ncbi:MAG: hypothetical protein D6696_12125, partial [Acidobacteria bacterium]
MADDDHDLLLGRLAVHFKVLSKERLAEALERRRLAGSHLDLGAFLVAESYLPPDTVKKLERARIAYLR